MKPSDAKHRSWSLTAGAVVAATVGSYAAGRWGDSTHFNVEIACVAGTAIGTLLLAIGTFRLASETALEIADRNRPDLVVTIGELQVAKGSNEMRLAVELTNVGRGAAHDIRMRGAWRDVGGTWRELAEYTEIAPLMAGGLNGNHRLDVPSYDGTTDLRNAPKRCEFTYCDSTRKNPYGDEVGRTFY